jgi:hypothetical protein
MASSHHGRSNIALARRAQAESAGENVGESALSARKSWLVDSVDVGHVIGIEQRVETAISPSMNDGPQRQAAGRPDLTT